MRTVRMPAILHEVFGETQSPAEIAAILGFGIAVPSLLAALEPGLFGAVSGWRAVLAFVLMFDVAAGCVANFTRGTSDYYAARPAHRWVFIAIHLHLPLIALALGAQIPLALAVWVYTVAAAAAVNLAAGRPLQMLLGGLLLAGGIVGVSLLVAPAPAFQMLSILFMVKVLFAFSVDLYAGTRPSRV